MLAPWNEIAVFSSMTRGMINLPSEGSIVQQDGTMPLGICNSNIRFSKIAPPTQC